MYRYSKNANSSFMVVKSGQTAQNSLNTLCCLSNRLGTLKVISPQFELSYFGNGVLLKPRINHYYHGVLRMYVIDGLLKCIFRATLVKDLLKMIIHKVHLHV